MAATQRYLSIEGCADHYMVIVTDHEATVMTHDGHPWLILDKDLGDDVYRAVFAGRAKARRLKEAK